MRHSKTSEDPLPYLRKESLDIYNRLHSIEEDIQFVHRIREVYAHLPLLRAEIVFRSDAPYIDNDWQQT